MENKNNSYVTVQNNGNLYYVYKANYQFYAQQMTERYINGLNRVPVTTCIS